MASRGSLSVYYYSGMREVFVGTLAATGVFFVAYKVWERNLENLLSLVAGLSACLIALFPTWPPSCSRPAHAASETPRGVLCLAGP